MWTWLKRLFRAKEWSPKQVDGKGPTNDRSQSVPPAAGRPEPEIASDHIGDTGASDVHDVGSKRSELEKGGAEVTLAPAPRDPRPEERSSWPDRQFHLGLDFGTCWSKMILRDYEAPSDRAYLLSPFTRRVHGLAGLIPSLIAYAGDSLYFGEEALRLQTDEQAIVYDSIKMRAFFPGIWPTDRKPGSLTCDDLATLVVIYLLRIAFEQAQLLGNRNRYRPRLTMTMGAPVSVTGDTRVLPRAVRMARLAHEAMTLRAIGRADTMTIREGEELLAEARERLDAKGETTHTSDWVRAESEAGLLWFFRSPAVRPGVYGSVDIGAGTTDVSFFRIWDEFQDGRWRPAGIQFHGDATGPVGMDLIGRKLINGGGQPYSIRGQEQDRFRCAEGEIRVQVIDCCKQMHGVYENAFHRGYRADPALTKWRGFGLFVMGGGSYFDPVLRTFALPPHPGLEFRAIDAGEPEDIFDIDDRRVSGSLRSLLVAYGLSFLGIEVPPTDQGLFEGDRRGRIQPLRQVDQDELYPP